MVLHVLNRGVNKREIFLKDSDYAAFERVMDLQQSIDKGRPYGQIA